MGALTTAGYGLLSVDGKLVYAHRLAFELVHGRSPLPGLDVCHCCDNRWCVNAERCLFEGTRLVNVQDALAKGRASRPPVFLGENHPHAKLSEAIVRSIRRLRAKGETTRAIAARLSLNHSTVEAVAARRLWRHVL
jgi:hypothetical protein